MHIVRFSKRAKHFSQLRVYWNWNNQPNSPLEIRGMAGGVDNRNFTVTYPIGGQLTNTQLAGLAHLSSELGRGWKALYAKQGSASFAAVFNGNTFFANGNVGIGTVNPDQKLSVACTVHAQAVKIDMIGWNDCVFNTDYKLSSLTQVRTFIDQNHHLPDMPTEKEVVAKGVNLGEIVKLQQEKDRRIDALSNRKEQ